MATPRLTHITKYNSQRTGGAAVALVEAANRSNITGDPGKRPPSGRSCQRRGEILRSLARSLAKANRKS